MSISRSASSYPAIAPPAPPATQFPAKDCSCIVGSSAAMKRLRLQVRRIGPHFRTVLLSGEAGTGKELVARALHGMIQGTAGPFVVCYKAAIEEALAEYESGARTADDVLRLVQGSVRGTLFLDGISELSLEAQGRLLRVLTQYESAQNRVDASQRMDLRIIASTSEDLRILVATGRFRQDSTNGLPPWRLLCRPYAIGWGISRSWRGAFWIGSLSFMDERFARLRMRRWSAYRNTVGREMWASWRTRCGTACCKARARCLGRIISRGLLRRISRNNR